VGHAFTAALLFSGDKLYMVSLLSGFEQQAYVQAVAALAKTFALVSLADAVRSLIFLIWTAVAAGRISQRSCPVTKAWRLTQET